MAWKSADHSAVAAALTDWWDRARRDLPWRARPGERADPYAVWLSEIMLQQTTVATVGPYFRRFLSLWPTVADLAAASPEDVMREWAGLGYYARARNLLACAKVVAAAGGRFPDDEAGLLALPGIGPYTAAAIAAIAFDRKASPVDGNIERVVARLFAVRDPLPGAKPALRRLAATLVPQTRPGDHAQAMMDLGAGICNPRKPRCDLCPLSGFCDARRLEIAADLPARMAKTERPQRHGVAFWLENDRAEVLLVRRPPRGLLGGMLALPSTPWRAEPWTPQEARAHAPAPADWQALPGVALHVFTHFRLNLTVWRGRGGKNGDGLWQPAAAIDQAGLPTAFIKAVGLVDGQRMVGK